MSLPRDLAAGGGAGASAASVDAFTKRAPLWGRGRIARLPRNSTSATAWVDYPPFVPLDTATWRQDSTRGMESRCNAKCAVLANFRGHRVRLLVANRSILP